MAMPELIIGGRDKGDEPKFCNVERGRERVVTLRPND